MSSCARAAAPGAHEIGPDERPRLVGAAQIGEVAACAIREIRRSARGGLRLRERARIGRARRSPAPSAVTARPARAQRAALMAATSPRGCRRARSRCGSAGRRAPAAGLRLAPASASPSALKLPFVAAGTVRSAIAGPRTPMTAPWCRRATVAAPFRPAKLPRTVSLVPASSAVASPAPVVLAAVEASIGTGRKRTLKLCCAPACSAMTRADERRDAPMNSTRYASRKSRRNHGTPQ